MTTEQQDEKDAQRQREEAIKRLSSQTEIRAWGMSGVPAILFGDPSEEELALAQVTAGHNGVLVLPEEMRPKSAFSEDLHEWGRRVSIADRMAADADEAQQDQTWGFVYEVFEKAGVADYTARDIVSALRDEGVDFLRAHRQDAWTTRGSRIPNTLVDMMPVAAYNLGWQEARDSVAAYIHIEPEEGEHTHRTREARDRCAAGDHEAAELYDQQADSLVHENEAHIREVYDLDGDDRPELSQAEEPIEQRLHRAFLNGYREGSERASWGSGWDYSR